MKLFGYDFSRFKTIVDELEDQNETISTLKSKNQSMTEQVQLFKDSYEKQVRMVISLQSQCNRIEDFDRKQRDYETIKSQNIRYKDVLKFLKSKQNKAYDDFYNIMKAREFQKEEYKKLNEKYKTLESKYNKLSKKVAKQ